MILSNAAKQPENTPTHHNVTHTPIPEISELRDEEANENGKQNSHDTTN